MSPGSARSLGELLGLVGEADALQQRVGSGLGVGLHLAEHERRDLLRSELLGLVAGLHLDERVAVLALDEDDVRGFQPARLRQAAVAGIVIDWDIHGLAAAQGLRQGVFGFMGWSKGPPTQVATLRLELRTQRL